MAEFEDKKAEEAQLTAEGGSQQSIEVRSGGDGGEDEEVLAAGELGSDKYVFAAFFAAGMGVAFLTGKILASVWNTLAEWPAAVRQVPQLLRYAEDERPTFTMSAGVVIAVFLVVVYARKEGVRSWADGVASELSKVHWPKREAVTNGTVVVLAAGLFATVYIGLLDRLWGFVTMLVYGA